MPRLEASIESATRTRVLEWGQRNDVALFFLKLNMIGSVGWPDRIILWQGRGILFVEFKRPGEKPRKLQSYIHHLLSTLGFEVQVHDDVDTAVEQITAQIGAETGATPWRRDHPTR